MTMGSLVLYRRIGEAIIIQVEDRVIEVIIGDMHKQRAKVVVRADKDIQVDRDEVYKAKKRRRV